MSNFFEELKHRNVYKVATAYAIASWLIIQVVDTIGPNLNWSDSVGPLVTKLLIVGFPIALILTWLYEFTPHGLKLTGKTQEDTSDNRKAGKRLNRMIIVALSLLIIVLLVDKLFVSGPVLYNEKQIASIGVLPFTNRSIDPEHEFYADSLTEQILNELASISALRVPARTSSFAFKDKNQDIRNIAELLRVNYVLEGSTRYDSTQNRIQITVHLINASTGYHIWSNTYDEYFVSIFDVQEDISRKVAKQLEVKLLPNEDTALASNLTDNTEAYKLFLKSREFSIERNDEDLKKAIDLLKQALELDPNFAEAHAELSFVYGQRTFYGNLNKDERDKLMEFHVGKAVEIAPEKPEVLRAKGRYNMGLRRDSTQVIADLRKALKLKPNYSDAHYLLYQALSWAQKPELAHKSLEKAVEVDPLNGFFNRILARDYFWKYDDHEKGLEIADRLLKNDPYDVVARFKSLMIAGEPYGDKVGSFKLVHRLIQKEPYAMGNINYNLLSCLSLDLLPLAEKYARIFQLRYPDNEGTTYNNVFALYAFKKDYSSMLDHINIWASEKNLDSRTYAGDLSWTYSLMGDNQKALTLFEESFPKLSDAAQAKEKLVETWEDWVLAGYIEYLRIEGEQEKADALSKVLCDFYTEKIENKEYKKAQIRDLKLGCAYAKNDIETFLSVLEEYYFERKDIRDIYTDLHSGYYRLFEDDPRYQKLFKRIRDDIHRQRAEVIAYLKEEGDWDPAWDKELGLD